MSSIQYKRLVQLYEQKPAEEADLLLREAFKAREIRADHVDLGRLFEECFGYSVFHECRRRERMVNHVIAERLTEAQGAVTTAAFMNITGQIVYSEVLAAYDDVANVFTKMIPEVQTEFLDGEKMAGITQIGDEAAVRPEATPYTLAGVGEDWIFTPATLDRGFIVPITWEALFADRTGVLMDRCKDGGKWLGINREKRAIDCVIDENTTAHRYNWRGTTIATYNDNTGTHTWDNLSASNALVDWTNLNTAEQLANGLLDPYTGEVIDIEFKHLIVPMSLEQTARRIVRQGSLAVTTPGYATSGQPSQHQGDNPYSNKYEVISSKRLAPRMAVKTSWFIGDVSKAFRYMQVEKPNVLQAPPNVEAEFSRRVVTQYRCNERGAYTTVQPRAMLKATVA